MKSSMNRFLSICAFVSISTTFRVSAEPDRDRDRLEEVVVTASFRVTAGGAQDINFARAEIEHGRIPHPDSMTAEGLLSEHDLLLPAKEPCHQLFCLTGEVAVANLPTLPRARYLVGLGFSSNVDPESWSREPINVVAVVDKSGSMSGEPLALVRRSLRKLVGAMRDGDQLSIVLYGDRSYVHLPPTSVTAASRSTLISAVNRIESAGSTNMEEGLKVGFDLARRTQPAYRGLTRVVLFTDERPNVGRTDAGSFGAMTKGASLAGIGMTTIGVGVQFDTKLATALSSMRGGNLFFLDSEDAADTIFDDELDYMVSELAHDVEISLRPDVSYRVAGVYGVPGELLGWQDDTTVTVKIPTVFLSRRGGGIFVSLAAADDVRDLPPRPSLPGSPVMAVGVSYLPVGASVPESAALAVTHPVGPPSAPMTLGGLLVDQYLCLRAATSAHYRDNDQESAYRILRDLVSRLDEVDDRRIARELSDEREVVGTLLERMAFLSGHGSEGHGSYGSSLFGDWEVARVAGDNDLFEEGDTLAFTVNNELVFFDGGGRGERETTYSTDYWASKREVFFPDEDLAARYDAAGERLTLRLKATDYAEASTVELVRLAPPGHD